MGFNGIYDGIPSGNLLQVAIENGPVEIVDLPIDSMVIFQFAKCKRLADGIWRFPLSHGGFSPS